MDEVVNDIPWDLVKLAADNWVTKLQMENLEASIEDAIVQDRWIEYTRRYYALKLRGDLTPLSKPVDSPVSFNTDYVGTFQLILLSGKPSMRIFSSTARIVAKVSKVSATVINP
jgi:endoribonuclease Dicer